MKMTIKNAIMQHGLEVLRGKPIDDGSGTPLYISDSDLDAAIALWEDEPENAHQHRRFYGATVRNANLVRWIYSSQMVEIDDSINRVDSQAVTA